MRLYLNILLGLFKFALAIGLLGGLTELTLNMRDDAVKAHRQGIISLRCLNKSLLEGGQHGQ